MVVRLLQLIIKCRSDFIDESYLYHDLNHTCPWNFVIIHLVCYSGRLTARQRADGGEWVAVQLMQDDGYGEAGRRARGSLARTAAAKRMEPQTDKLRHALADRGRGKSVQAYRTDRGARVMMAEPPSDGLLCTPMALAPRT